MFKSCSYLFSKMNAQKDKILSYEREVTNNEGKITYSQSLLPSFDDEKVIVLPIFQSSQNL